MAIAFVPCAKNGDRERGNFLFVSRLNPIDKIVRLVQAKVTQNRFTEGSPFVVAIEVIDSRAAAMQRDVITAAFIAQHMPPTTDARSLTVGGTTKTKRTGPAEYGDFGEMLVSEFI